MARPHQPHSCLPWPLPSDRTERTVMFAMRRMAVHGVRDANAAWLMLDLLGVNFRRPLVLLRAFLLELSFAARGPIRIAPCCAPRMTAEEREILTVLMSAAADMDAARYALAQLTGNPGVEEPLSAAAIFSRAIGEASGSPVRVA